MRRTVLPVFAVIALLLTTVFALGQSSPQSFIINSPAALGTGLQIPNIGTVPVANPSSGTFLYSTGGTLGIRGSAGSVLDTPIILGLGTVTAQQVTLGNTANTTTITTLMQNTGHFFVQTGAATLLSLGAASGDYTAYGTTPGTNGHVRCTSGDNCMDSPGALDIGAAAATSVVLGGNSNVDGTASLTPVSSHLAFKVFDTSSSTPQVTMGSYALSGGSTGYGAEWFEVTPSTTNFAFLSDGSNTWLNAPTGQINFKVSNAGGMTMTTTDFYPSAAGGLTMGSNNAWGSTYLGGGNTGNQGFVAVVGTHDAQLGLFQHIPQYLKTTDTSTHAITLVSGATANHVYNFTVDWTCIWTGTPANYDGGRNHATCSNVAGAVACSATTQEWHNSLGTEGCNPPAFVTSGSGTNININVSAGVTNAIDWQLDPYFEAN